MHQIDYGYCSCIIGSCQDRSQWRHHGQPHAKLSYASLGLGGATQVQQIAIDWDIHAPFCAILKLCQFVYF